VLLDQENNRELLVDELLGKQEAVIKSLGDAFQQAPAIAGGAILGDGRVGLILDANALVSLRCLPSFLAA
jgi:two-component system, chemotaxis family, sensor kinase CheA